MRFVYIAVIESLHSYLGGKVSSWVTRENPSIISLQIGKLSLRCAFVFLSFSQKKSAWRESTSIICCQSSMNYYLIFSYVKSHPISWSYVIRLFSTSFWTFKKSLILFENVFIFYTAIWAADWKTSYFCRISGSVGGFVNCVVCSAVRSLCWVMDVRRFISSIHYTN